MAFDTETTGDFSNMFERRVVMLQLGDQNTQFIVDVRQKDPTKLLQELSNKTLIGHNIKYDYQVIKTNYNITLENLFDTMLASQVIECGMDQEEKKGWFSLEGVANRYLNQTYYSKQGNLFAPTITKQIRESFKDIGQKQFSREQLYYGALDVCVAFLLWKRFIPLIEESELSPVMELENEFLKVLGDMELNGVWLNQQQWLTNYRRTLNESEKKKQQLLAVHNINWDSYKQVLPVMKELGVDVSVIDKKTGEIKESVANAVLSKQLVKAPLLKLYLDYKLSSKESSTYGEKFLRHVNPTTQRVHSSFMQIMRTGRTSSTNPNIQNIKRGAIYRSAFQAEEGNSIVAFDFSNIEARVLADKCGDENFINIFLNNGDYHLETAKLAFDNPNLTKGDEERQLAKTINFAIAFGAGAKKISEGAGVSLMKGKELLNKVFTAFPALKPYFEEQGKLAKARGYFLCNDISKRRSYIPFYKDYLAAKAHVQYFKARGWDPNPIIERAYQTWDSKIQRWSQNIPVQATAADIAKKTGVKLRRYAKKLDFKIILFVHDEYVTECHHTRARTVAALLSQVGEETAKSFLKILSVPAEAQISSA